MKLSPRRSSSAAAVAVLTAIVVLAGDVIPAAASARPTASDVEIAVRVTSDGLGRFTADDRPGGDSGPSNGIVRTGDAVVYSVTVGTSHGSATGGEFTLTAPPGLRWSRLPDECVAEGSEIDGDALRCRLGTLTSGARTVSVAAGVAVALPHETPLAVTAEARADDNDPVSTSAPVVTVSAVPRFDVSMDRALPSLTAATGPDGSTPGFRLVYPLLVHWDGLVEGGGLLGYEPLGERMTLMDDVSAMYGGAPSPAVLAPVDGAPACGPNTGQVPSMPGGSGGGARNVLDSGDIVCTQTAPGEPVSITITGTDTSMSSVPTKNIDGGDIVGGALPYVVSAYISLWIPELAESESILATNSYRDFATASVTGRSNYDGEGEPRANNSVARDVSRGAGAGGSLRYLGIDVETGASYNLSGKNNLPYVTPAQHVMSMLGVRNAGTTAWHEAVSCIVFDNSVQTLREQAPGLWATSTQPGVTGRPEFAAFDGSDPATARDASCGDDDLAWHDDPRSVPGGADAVGAVRWTYDHPATTSLTFGANLRIEPRLDSGTRPRTFAAIRTSPTGDWTNDRNDADAANGGWADFLTVTSNMARIRSAVVDPGHDAESTPDETTYVTSGATATYALYPSLTNASDDRVDEALTVRAHLPAGTTYVGGSSPAPEVDEVEIDGVVRQRLTWRLAPVSVNDPVAALTVDVRFDRVPAGTEARLEAIVASERDVSAEWARVTHRTVTVLEGGGFDAEETVDHPVRVIGDDATFTLTYRNTGGTSLPGSTLISVLPHGADGRGTTGDRAVLDRALTADAPTDEIRYTATPSSDVSADPVHPSNLADGATAWCLIDEFGSIGCPTALDAVTAVRVDRSEPVGAGVEVSHELVVDGTAAGLDAWASTFGLRVVGIDWTATSTVATTRAVAGSIGRQVWFDTDRDGVRSDDEPVAAGHPVSLHGTDDRGDDVAASAETDADGRYEFAALRPGDYVVDFGTAAHGWTLRDIGDDTRDSDVDEKGRARAVLETVTDDGRLVGVTRHGHVDAGLLPEPLAAGDEGRGDDLTAPLPSDADEAPPAGPDDATADSAADASGSLPAPRLAFTGGTALAPLLAAAALSVAAGLLLVMLRRRRARSLRE
ncbi:SdrD B-like domain-containing protein [Frigoribacterium faeni]|uniref:Putative repeat protein (TIGR01451 family) n=1 Tax=Frigoribacterium faeni TaxID=145483 RepID=A0A7W3JIL4_9MICO|nr:SdrD B-like domain-containing protein [Frigoribacterium faeni]MBA8813531.1 putative repeat protein (TIGR01451 family) [Frigoribacterium faeni]GEK82751.1 hypothetical protein FFA01_10600 [Frigoribacterium faeni]